MIAAGSRSLFLVLCSQIPLFAPDMVEQPSAVLQGDGQEVRSRGSSPKGATGRATGDANRRIAYSGSRWDFHRG
jgi:hypothetical protein